MSLSSTFAALAVLLAGPAGTSPRPLPVSEWSIEGDQAGARLGSALATADVNGDGFEDLVVGAPFHDDLHVDEGRVRVYLGSAGGLSLAPAWQRFGRQKGAHFGARIASAGDVDADGYADVLIASPEFDRPLVPSNPLHVGALDRHESGALRDAGRVQLYLGSPTGLSAAQASVLGIELDEHLGAALAGAGDVDGDGFDDVLIGASHTQGNRGGVFLFTGSPAGIGPSPSWFRIGDVPGTGFGTVIGSAGRADNDGFDDIVISEPGRSTCGRMQLFSGNALGLSTTPSQTVFEKVVALGPAADFDLNGPVDLLYVRGTCTPAPTEARHRSFFPQTNGTLPTHAPAVAMSAGDVDGDGRIDLVAGSPAFSEGDMHGRVHVYLNQPGTTYASTTDFLVFDGDQAGAGFGAALATGDVDGDGSDELFVAAPDHSSGEAGEGMVALFPGWHGDVDIVETPYSPIQPQAFGAGTATGDFDGDGFADLLVASADVSPRIAVHPGSPSGLPATPDLLMIWPPAAPPNNVADLNCWSTGDADGDGFDDLLVSVTEFWIGHGGFGGENMRHELYLGSPTGLALDPDTTISGSAWDTAEFVGDVNGDGFDDVVVDRSGLGDHLLLGSNAGLSTDPAQTLPGNLRASSGRHRGMLSGNLNADAYGDVLLVRTNSTVDVYAGSPAGLVLQENWNLGSNPVFLGWADLDGDGIGDLLTETTVGRTLSYRGSPTGFTRVPEWWDAVGTSPLCARVEVVLDADLDGFADLLLAGERLHLGSLAGISRTPVWTGDTAPVESGPRSVGDFDGDDLVEVVSGLFFDFVYVFEIQH